MALEFSPKPVGKERHFRSPSCLSLFSPDLTAAATAAEVAATDDGAAAAGSARGSSPGARPWRWPTVRSEAARPAAPRCPPPRLPLEPGRPRPAARGLDRIQARRRHRSLDHLPAGSGLPPHLAARDTGRLLMALSTPRPGSARGALRESSGRAGTALLSPPGNRL